MLMINSGSSHFKQWLPLLVAAGNYTPSIGLKQFLLRPFFSTRIKNKQKKQHLV